MFSVPTTPEKCKNATITGNTGFVPFFKNKFPGLFQDSDWFFQDSKIHINPITPKILMLILLAVCHKFHIFLLEFNRFPELSRTSSPFPGLSRPGKGHNKIPGLSRFSRTRTSPVILDLCLKKTRTGKSHDYREVIVLKKLRFKMFSVHTKMKSRRFQISPVWRAFSKSSVSVTD